MMEELTPLVQPISIDEAFWILPGTERLHKDTPARTLARFAARVEAEIGITLSVGLSYCKFLAKVASDLDKPRGFSVIGKQEALSFWRPGRVADLGRRQGLRGHAGARRHPHHRAIADHGGNHADAPLRRDGQSGCSTWRAARMSARFTPMRGPRASRRNHLQHRPVEGRRISCRCSGGLSEKVSARLKASGIAGQTVVLKLKTADFKSRTRNFKLEDPTVLADRIFRTGLHLLERELGGDRFRLIGIGVSDLTGAAGRPTRPG
jgi:DNA polymerase-4